jgi:hypothetical protein
LRSVSEYDPRENSRSTRAIRASDYEDAPLSHLQVESKMGQRGRSDLGRMLLSNSLTLWCGGVRAPNTPPYMVVLELTNRPTAIPTMVVLVLTKCSNHPTKMIAHRSRIPNL